MQTAETKNAPTETKSSVVRILHRIEHSASGKGPFEHDGFMQTDAGLALYRGARKAGRLSMLGDDAIPSGPARQEFLRACRFACVGHETLMEYFGPDLLAAFAGRGMDLVVLAAPEEDVRIDSRGQAAFAPEAAKVLSRRPLDAGKAACAKAA